MIKLPKITIPVLSNIVPPIKVSRMDKILKKKKSKSKSVVEDSRTVKAASEWLPKMIKLVRFYFLTPIRGHCYEYLG